MKNKKRIITTIVMILMAGVFSCPCQADDFGAVNTKFQSFSRAWVIKLQASYLHSKETPSLVKQENQYVASYYYLDENSIKTDIKQARGSNTTYTGLLQYNEYLLQSIAQTQSLAKAGPFVPKSLKQMTEIFLYENGSWIR